MNILKMLTNNTIQMNNTIATMAFDILQDLKLKDESLRNSLNRTDFSSNYLQTLSALDKYAMEKIQFLTDNSRRNLFQNTMSY